MARSVTRKRQGSIRSDDAFTFVRMPRYAEYVEVDVKIAGALRETRFCEFADYRCSVTRLIATRPNERAFRRDTPSNRGITYVRKVAPRNPREIDRGRDGNPKIETKARSLSIEMEISRA